MNPPPPPKKKKKTVQKPYNGFRIEVVDGLMTKFHIKKEVITCSNKFFYFLFFKREESDFLLFIKNVLRILFSFLG